jgi:septal ring-binding cell division protein DamX
MNKTIAIAPKNILIIFALLYVWQIQAQEPAKDTDIVCFAAQKKWICAPKDNQKMAQEKAGKLIKQDSNNSEVQKSEVVVRSLNIPKIEAIDYSAATSPVDEPTIQSSKEEIVEEPPLEPSKIQSEYNTKPESIKDYADFWSYQLIGVSTQQAAIKYVEQNQLNKLDVLIVESEHQGYDWFVVLFKLYQDRTSAIQDLNNLPSNLKKPWLRPLKNLVIKSFIEDF